MKKTLLLLLMLFVLPIVIATDVGYVNQTMTVFSSHPLAISGYFDNVTAYISILFPDGTQSILSQQAFPSPDIPGVFGYNYTPNQTGTYYTTTQFYNSTDDIGTGSDTFFVKTADIAENDGMTGLGVIIAIGIAIAIFAYLAFAFKSENEGTNTVWRVMSMIMMVLLLVLLAWSSIDSNQACAFVPGSNGAYTLQCVDGPATAGTMFLKLMLVVMVIFFVWISVALFITSINKLRETGKL